MTIAQPKILFAMDGTSGATVHNYGSTANAAVQASSVENSDWAWVAGATPLLSYLSLITKDSGGASTQPFIDLTGYTLGTTFTHIYTACGFRIASYDNSILNQGYLASNSSGRGGVIIRVIAPTAGGDFNLECKLETSGFFVVGENTFTGLTFGTDYRIIAHADMTSTSAAQAKFLLDSGSVQKPATTNPGGDTWDTDAGYIDRRHDFDIYGGVTGRIYYWAHDRGVLLSDGDMSAINADPTVWSGWPSSGSTRGGPFGGGTAFNGGRTFTGIIR